MTLSYIDANNNTYFIENGILVYKAVKAINSSSGNYSGGRDKIIALLSKEIEALKAFLELLDFTSSLSPRTKGQSLLYYSDHKFSFAYGSKQQTEIESILKSSLKAKAIQSEHLDFESQNHDLQICLILDGISSAENIGMAIRLADAFGVKEMVLLESGLDQISPKIDRISRQTANKLDIKFYTDQQKLIEELKERDLFFIALEDTDRSIALGSFKVLNNRSVAIIVGSEQNGVSQDLIDFSQVQLHIPMYGINSSMNVIHALAIGLQHCVRL